MLRLREPLESWCIALRLLPRTCKSATKHAPCASAVSSWAAMRHGRIDVVTMRSRRQPTPKLQLHLRTASMHTLRPAPSTSAIIHSGITLIVNLVNQAPTILPLGTNVPSTIDAVLFCKPHLYQYFVTIHPHLSSIHAPSMLRLRPTPRHPSPTTICNAPTHYPRASSD